MADPISRTFGRPRPSQAEVEFIQAPSDSTVNLKPLPKPTGKKPFHLDISSVLDGATIAAITQKKKLVFHTAGDMGGIAFSVPQQLVANHMERDFTAAPGHLEDNPAFFYGLGDCVYFYGMRSQYFVQFYQPYEHYPAPIFAVPGNHDGDTTEGETSLDGFLRNFCSKQPVITPESGDTGRHAMTQPNVFWSLTSPMATIIGLYSNVPEQGRITKPQMDWFISELKTASKDKTLLVTMHHPVFSADDHHSGSGNMKRAVDDAVKASGREPDMVLAGHVHNYQRFTKNHFGKKTPYIVAGAGGYHNLHSVARVNGERLVPPLTKTIDGDDITLERYLDDRHGFLRLEVGDPIVLGKYYSVPRPQESWSASSKLVDLFRFNWRTHQFA